VDVGPAELGERVPALLAVQLGAVTLWLRGQIGCEAMAESTSHRTVVVTGAFGNVGVSTVGALLSRGHHVVALDLPALPHRAAASRLRGRGVETVWGDVTDSAAVAAVVDRADAVVHLAALIPPHSGRRPELARRVNVEGTRIVAEAVARAPRRPRLVYASSLSVYGRTQHLPAPRLVTDPVDPVDPYGHTKAAAEEIVRGSGTDWVILRFAAVLPLRLPLLIDPLMFEVPLTDRVEFVHTRDVGFAAARACELPGLTGMTLHVGGGPVCQLRQREIIGRSLSLLGVGVLPEAAFSTTPFHCDWLDTRESQRLLGFQQRSFADYLVDLHRRYRWRRPVVWAVAPLIRWAMLRGSPYWRASRGSDTRRGRIPDRVGS
jgi:UDP-glucose 4-epimerase